jgi:UDP-glucuronate 4-epimerase
LSAVMVTGAAGFIGSHLTERLLELGHEVIGVDGFTENYSREQKLKNLSRAISNERFRLVEEDLLEIELADLLQETDSVVHLAAEPGVRASWDNFPTYLRRNIEATHRLLEAMVEIDVDHLLFASSSSVYGSAEHGPLSEDARRRPASPYGLSKLAAEELVALYGREKAVPATTLRYFTVYGPRQRPEMALASFISAAARGVPITVFGDGEQVREMTYVSDVVDATVAALETLPGGVYNVGGGTRVTVNEMIQTVEAAFGTEVEKIHVPRIAGEARTTWADLTRTRRDLGFKPRVSLEDGIAAQVEWVLAMQEAQGG